MQLADLFSETETLESLESMADDLGVDIPSDPPTFGDVEAASDDLLKECNDTGGKRLRELEEKGHPGTKQHSGRLQPPVPKYGPYTVRGSHGQWGDYEEWFRSMPSVFEPITSAKHALVESTHEVQMPRQVNDDQRETLETFVAWCNSWLRSIEGGLEKFVAEASSVLIYGFAPFEVVWAEDDEGRKHPVKLAFREQSTVDHWIFDEKARQLLGAEFQSFDGGYALPYTGSRLTDRKLMVPRIHARGLNVEGISLLRPCIHAIKALRLIWQISVVASQKYGGPITVVRETEAAGQMMPSGGADEDDVADAGDVFRNIRSSEGPVVELPMGLEVEIIAPDGKIPSTLVEFLRFNIERISQVFSNSSKLLGLHKTQGSYALADVQDNQALRMVSPTANAIFRPVNRLIRDLAKVYIEPEIGRLPTYPTVETRLGLKKNTSKWVEDITKVMGKTPATKWPKPLRSAVAEELDLPDGVFERQGPAPGQQRVPGTAETEDDVE